MTKRRVHAALSSAFLGFVALLVAGALLWQLLDPGVQSVLDAAGNATPAKATAANDVRQNTRTIWDSALFYVVFLGLVSFLGKAVRESRRP